MTLKEKQNEYLKGKIDKNTYMSDMFSVHQYLFEYPDLIKNSAVQKIEISSDRVTFVIHSGSRDIKLCCAANEAQALPMSFLNLSSVEAEESKMIHRLIKPGDVVFDIGANIGWYSINILLECKGTIVYSFEPIKSSYQYLLKNLELNGQETDKTFNIGLSNENKKDKFYFDQACSAASSMANLREDEKTVVEECKIKRLDDFAPAELPIKRLDFIKCDVEGAELFVFQGARETIVKYQPIIFSEILRKWSKKFGYHPNDIIKFFQGLDYECYVIRNDKLARFGYVDEETKQTNFLFFHKKKHANVIKNLI